MQCQFCNDKRLTAAATASQSTQSVKAGTILGAASRSNCYAAWHDKHIQAAVIQAPSRIRRLLGDAPGFACRPGHVCGEVLHRQSIAAAQH